MTERTSREIERDIDRTRAELDHTLDQVQEKLSPSRWMDEGLDYLRGAGGGDIVRGIASVARDYPIPVAMIVGGSAWLYFAMRNAAARRDPLEARRVADPYAPPPALPTASGVAAEPALDPAVSVRPTA